MYHLDAVQLATVRVAEKDVRKDQMVGIWTLASREKKSGARRDIVLDMFASRGSLVRAAARSRVRLHDAQVVVSNSDTTPHQYSIEIQKTHLVWNGRALGHGSRVEQPIRESWSLPALRGGIWNADFAFLPDWSWPGIGSLRVEGKGALAKALKASPIRFVGPFFRGGGGELRFFR
jgi:hypothetical protein